MDRTIEDGDVQSVQDRPQTLIELVDSDVPVPSIRLAFLTCTSLASISLAQFSCENRPNAPVFHISGTPGNFSLTRSTKSRTRERCHASSE